MNQAIVATHFVYCPIIVFIYRDISFTTTFTFGLYNLTVLLPREFLDTADAVTIKIGLQKFLIFFSEKLCVF